MEQQNYHNSIQVSASAADAYTQIANVAGWWAKNFKGEASKAGDRFTVQFGETKVDFEISEAIPGINP